VSPLVPISWGELFDKMTILEIKAERLSSAQARHNVGQELALLAAAAETALCHPATAALKAKLKQINETLWTIEDDIRAREAQQSFDAEFIRLARAVYHNNDERGRLKAEINRLLASDITEEKQYTKY
jgi:Family of unknown function (DUF6165)